MTTPPLDRAALRERIEGLRKFFAAHVTLDVYSEVCIRVEHEFSSLLDALDAAERERDEARKWLEAERYEGQRDRNAAHDIVAATAKERDAALASAAAAEERGRAAIEALDETKRLLTELRWAGWIADIHDPRIGEPCCIECSGIEPNCEPDCRLARALALPTAPRPPEDAAPRCACGEIELPFGGQIKHGDTIHGVNPCYRVLSPEDAAPKEGK